MRIALVQIASPSDETPADRRTRVRRILADLPRDVDLVVLPELWAVGFNHFDDYIAEAETLDGPTVRVAVQAARELDAWVLGGSIVEQIHGEQIHGEQIHGEQIHGGALRNTTVLVDPTGHIANTTSKIHVFGHASREVELLSPGDSISTTATPFGRVGSTTCYDLRFPGLWNELVDAGAELVLVPAAWPAARLAHWRLLTAARAVDTQTFVVACNSCGRHGGVEQGGHSRVVDPWGELVAEAGADEEVLLVDIDPTQVDRTRVEFPVLADRLDDYHTLRTSEVIA
jgi:predicted amidohydrolase